MACAATIAPASVWCARPWLTPSSSARSAAAIREMNALTWVRPVRVSARRTYGPLELGAAPASRASVRKVLLVATTLSGRPAANSRCAGLRNASATNDCNAATSAFAGGSASNHSRVRRAAPRGSEMATAGSSSAPAASSSDPPPMSRLMRLPALHPSQRRTARKVRRASSSPVTTLRSTPASSATRSSTAAELPASRTADVANASNSSQPSSLASLRAWMAAATNASAPASARLPFASICSARRSSLLCEAGVSAARRGERPRPAGGPCWTPRREPRAACIEP